jgi:hypothetical protein
VVEELVGRAAQTESDAGLLWAFVDVHNPTKDEIEIGLGFSSAKISRLSKHLAREMDQPVIIPPSRPTPDGRWEYHTSFDAEHSALWVAWSLKHVASRAAWIGEMSERLSEQFPDDVLFSVIQATANALQAQATAARAALQR